MLPVPDEVDRLQFEDISDRAVKVVWSPPEHINGILTGYTLTYMVRDRPDTLKTENFTADTLSVKVTQLQVRDVVKHYLLSRSLKNPQISFILIHKHLTFNYEMSLCKQTL